MSRPHMSRPDPGRRAEYRRFHPITTRWEDNDVFGHVNNVVYYSFFDTAVTFFLLERGLLVREGAVITVVAETRCRFLREIAFPDRVTVGLRVARLGGSSVRYELAVFRGDDDAASAEGHFVHVFVARDTMRPVPIPPAARAALSELLTEREEPWTRD